MLAEKVQILISDALAGDPVSVIALGCFVAVYSLLTLVLLRQLMSRDGSGWKKVFWAVVLFVPVLGWMFYLAFYTPPASRQFR
ncbi:PLDc N-terminal domain-containing protein [Rubritalea sp.]|uniref:PLDc N-terminal domain-containing protein n=1 Tax=Rubritalea sp. TaxID=2109375 RepID=UPI003EF4DFF1